jgi:acyl dehydratase
VEVKTLRPTSDGRRGVVQLAFDVVNQSGRTVQAGTNTLLVHA